MPDNVWFDFSKLGKKVGPRWGNFEVDLSFDQVLLA
jgi:hypothetical protein